MSFLHKLWDETLAGPAPDSGLSRLRKYNSFSASRSPPMLSNDNDAVSNHIPRRIEIPTPTPTPTPTDLISPSSFLPHSPAAPSTPRTPPPTPPETPRGEDHVQRLRRRRSIDFPRPRPRPLDQPTPTTPSVYDWIVITALDR